MDRDPLVRLLLFGILAALVALVARAGGDGGSPIVGPGGGDGRYTLYSERAGTPILFRMDSRSGTTWKLELRGGGNRWKPVLEPDEDAGDSAGPPDASSATPRIPLPPKTPVPPLPPLPAPATPPPPGREGPEWDVEALARALERPELNVDLRIWSAGRLALQDVPRSTEALLSVQGDGEPAVVAAALAALAGRYDPRIPEAVARARAHPDPAVQAAAAALATE